MADPENTVKLEGESWSYVAVSGSFPAQQLSSLASQVSAPPAWPCTQVSPQSPTPLGSHWACITSLVGPVVRRTSLVSGLMVGTLLTKERQACPARWCFWVGRTGVRGYGIFLCSSVICHKCHLTLWKEVALLLLLQKGRIFPGTAFLVFVLSEEVDT